MSTSPVPAASGGAAAAPASAPSRWIISKWADLTLFVATPLLIIPVFFLARTRVPLQDIALIVLAFGALGHHLPGMIRAYGDKALFREYRTRFSVSPVLLVAVCTFLYLNDLRVLILAIYLWGTWHGLMQTYGFVRIYDAKVGSVHPATQKLDFLLCLCWIGTGMLISPTRMYQLTEYWYLHVGAPIPSAAVITGIQGTAIAATAIVTILAIANHFKRAAEGKPPSPVKAVLVVTSISFWWWANMAFDNMLVGVILFEVFHDVQYLAIVWVFNKARAEKDPEAGGFTRFLFGRGGQLAILYVGLVFAYGSLRFVERGIDEANLKNAMAGLLAASTLLHFYYDGFIWKFRKQKNTEALNIQRSEKESRRFLLPGDGWWHGAKWAMFLIPLTLLGWNEMENRAYAADRLERLATVLPDNPYVHHELGKMLRNRIDDPEAQQRAMVAFERAMELGISSPGTGYYLGALRARAGDHEGAVAAFEHSIASNPFDGPTHARLGDSLVELGRTDDAEEAYRTAIELDGSSWRGHLGLAKVAAMRGDGETALVEARRGLEHHGETTYTEGTAVGMLQYESGGGLHYERMSKLKDPLEVRVVARHLDTVGRLAVQAGAPDAAEEILEIAIAVAPESPHARFSLGAMYALTGRAEQAVPLLREAARIEPAAGAFVFLGRTLEDLDRLEEARDAYLAALVQEPQHEAATQRLASVRAKLGSARR